MKKAIFRFIISFIFYFILRGAVYGSVEPYPTDAALEIDGEMVQLTEVVYMANDRSLLPMRDFFQTIGAKVEWDNSRKAATATRNGKVIEFVIGKNKAISNDKTILLDTPAVIINKKTYIPIRAGAESLGYDVFWDDGIIKMSANLDLEKINTEIDARIKGKFDSEWSIKDREDFIKLYNKAKTKKVSMRELYEESYKYKKTLEHYERQAFRSKRGYVLYSPDLTTKVNYLRTAVIAREKLAASFFKDTVVDLEFYYPSGSKYRMMILDYERRATTSRYKNGELIGTETKEFELAHTDDFNYYDHAEAINILENIDVPDYYVSGVNFYFIKGVSNFNNFLDDNTQRGTRGFHMTNRSILNEKTSREEFLASVYRVVGHNVTYEMLNNWEDRIGGVNDISKDEVMENKYRSLYGFPEDSRGTYGVIGGNIIEDFVATYMEGYKKKSFWQTNNTQAVKDFFAKNIENFDSADVFGYKGITIHNDGATIYLDSDNILENKRTIITRDPKFTIEIKDTGKSEAPLDTLVAGHGSEEGYSYKVNASGTFEFNLPSEGLNHIVVRFRGGAVDNYKYIDVLHLEVVYLP